MNINTESFIKFLGLFLAIFFIIFLLAVFTPKAASFVDRFIGKVFKNKSENDISDFYKVKSIYDKPDNEALKENNQKDGKIENGKE